MEKSAYDFATLPLHGVKLNFTPSQKTADTNQPFHLNVTLTTDSVAKPINNPIWSMTDTGERYTSIVELYKNNNTYTLNVQCEGSGEFVFADDHLTINWQAQGTNFEHYLQSLGVAFWLEQQGVPCIHANAIMLDNAASLIIAPSRTGKSTLTTHLHHQGFKLMTDDMAAIHLNKNHSFSIYPSWPKVRLWPDVIDSLVGTELDAHSTKKTNQTANTNNTLDNSTATLGDHKRKKVHQKFAKYELEYAQNTNLWEKSPQPLKAIYLLDRQDNKHKTCEITPINPSAGLMILLQNSMLANAYQSMGIETDRLQRLAKLLGSVPMFKITYSSGLDNLDNVGITLQAQLKSL